MRVCITSFLKSALVATMLVAGLFSSAAMGQEGSPARSSRGSSGLSSAPPEAAGKLIAFEVTIVERAGEHQPGQKGKPPTPTQIAELEKDPKAATVQRLQLVALENTESRLQLGESAPMVTSRTLRGREGGAAFGGAGGFPGSESITYTEIGTLLSVTARVETDGKIVANLHVARTNLAPSKPAEKPDGQETTAFNYPRKLTSTISTTARLVSGEPVVLAAQQSQASGTPSETWVLVTAKVQ